MPYVARFAGQGPLPAGLGSPSSYLNESVPGQQAVGRRTEALLDFILGHTQKPFLAFLAYAEHARRSASHSAKLLALP